MSSGRHADKPWMRPPQYTETRFKEAASVPSSDPKGEESAEHTADEIDERIRRPPRDTIEREYECTDQSPINYGKGPHDDEFGVEDDESIENDIDYDRGPDDEEEFGEDDELERVDDDADEFPDDV